MTPEEKKKLEEKLLELVPAGEETISNKKLQERFLKQGVKLVPGIHPDDYWTIRNRLIDAGALSKARGRGGTVYRTPVAPTSEPTAAAEPGVVEAQAERERDLYEPFYRTLADFWVKDNAIKESVIELTALQGRRSTGGIWTRPDVTLIAVGNYQFIPGKILEVTTFEVKGLGNYDITGVFEAAAHSAFAHKSYLAVQTSDADQDHPDLERMKTECRRFGVGLILFEKAEDWNTYEVAVEPERREPDPRSTDDFITKQIKLDNQRKILEYLK